MADLGSLFVKIDADTKSFNKKIGDSETRTKNTQKKMSESFGKMSKAGTLAFTGIAVSSVALVKQLGNQADKLLDLEQITGLSTDTLQEFENIARVAGVSFEGLTGIVQKFSSRLPTIEAGTSESAKAFKKLNVELKTSDGSYRDANELVPELITALQGMEDITDRNATAQQVFGRSLGDLAPVLGMSADETKRARDEAHELGLVWSRDSIVSANNFRVELEGLSASFKAQSRELGMSLMPIIKDDLIPLFFNMAKAVGEGVSKFTNLESGTKKFLIGLTGAVAILPSAITGVKALGIAFAGAGGPITLISIAITGIIAGLTLLKEQKLKELKKEFGGLSEEIGRSDTELKKIQSTFVVYNMQSQKGMAQEQKNLVKMQELYGISRRDLIKILATSKNLDAGQQERFKNEADGYRLIDELIAKKKRNAEEQAELEKMLAEQEAQRQKDLEDANKIRLANEQTLEEETLLKKTALEEEYSQKLLEQSGDRLAILEKEKTGALALAEETGADTQGIIEYYANEEDKIRKETAQAEKDRIEELKTKKLDALQEELDFTMGIANSINSIYQNSNQERLNEIDKETTEKIDALDKELLGEDAYADAVKKIKKESAKKAYDIKLEEFKTNKALALVQIAVDTAMGIAKTYGQTGIFGAAAMVPVIAMGVAQAAVVASQPEPPMPAFAQGGVVKRETKIIAGESGGDVLLGMGAKGDPLIKELSSRIASNIGGQQPTQIIINSLYPPRRQDLDRLARDLFISNVKEQQRRGITA